MTELVKTYSERAAEAAELAAQTRDPELRRACIDLAEGWTRLDRQQQALGGPAASLQTDAVLSSEPAASE